MIDSLFLVRAPQYACRPLRRSGSVKAGQGDRDVVLAALIVGPANEGGAQSEWIVVVDAQLGDELLQLAGFGDVIPQAIRAHDKPAGPGGFHRTRTRDEVGGVPPQPLGDGVCLRPVLRLVTG